MHQRKWRGRQLTFLGIEVDTEVLVLRLPAEKLEGLKALISTWLERWWCFRTEFQSLASKFQHACKVVHPVQSFLRQVLGGIYQGYHHIRLNLSIGLGLVALVLGIIKQCVLLWPARLAAPDHELFADASGSFGCDAIWHNLAGKLKKSRLPITPKILQPVKNSWEHLPSQRDAVMLWEASTFCFLRMGEAVSSSESGFNSCYHLAYGHIRVNSRVKPFWIEV